MLYCKIDATTFTLSWHSSHGTFTFLLRKIICLCEMCDFSTFISLNFKMEPRSRTFIFRLYTRRNSKYKVRVCYSTRHVFYYLGGMCVYRLLDWHLKHTVKKHPKILFYLNVIYIVRCDCIFVFIYQRI